jgi:hypothetical protein
VTCAATGAYLLALQKGMLRFTDDLIARVARAGAGGIKLLCGDEDDWLTIEDYLEEGSNPAGEVKASPVTPGRSASGDWDLDRKRGSVADLTGE